MVLGCDGLIFWGGSALLRFGETGEAPVAAWLGPHGSDRMGLARGGGTGSIGEREADLFRELQVGGSEQSFVALRGHREGADARDFRFDLCIDETQQRIDLIRIEHLCVRSPMIAAGAPIVRGSIGLEP